MGFLFTALLLMVVSVCPGRTNPILGTNMTNPMDSEHSGTGEPGSNFAEGFDGGRDPNVVWNTIPDLSVNDTTAPPEPSPIGKHIVEFINQHMIYIIIAGVMLVLVVVSVCTAVLVRQNYKASAYYPASYPQQTYVDEQEKEGAVKTFSEVPDQLGGPPRVEVVDCSSQLKADILAAAHSLKRTLPPKAEVGVIETPVREGSERLPQAVGREKGDKATPEVGGQEVEQGPNSKAKEDNGDEAKATVTSGADGDSDQEGPTLAKEEEEEEGKRESGVKEERSDEEGEEKEGGEEREKAEPGEETAKSGSDVVNKPPVSAGKPRETPQRDAKNQAPGEAEAEGVDKPLRPTGQEAKEVKPAPEDITRGLKAAVPGPEGLGDQEKTPLIPKQDSASGDTTAM